MPEKHVHRDWQCSGDRKKANTENTPPNKPSETKTKPTLDCSFWISPNLYIAFYISQWQWWWEKSRHEQGFDEEGVHSNPYECLTPMHHPYSPTLLSRSHARG